MWRQCFFSLHNVYHSPSTGQVLHLSQWCRNGHSLFSQHSKHLVMLEDFCWVVWFAWSCCYEWHCSWFGLNEKALQYSLEASQTLLDDLQLASFVTRVQRWREATCVPLQNGFCSSKPETACVFTRTKKSEPCTKSTIVTCREDLNGPRGIQPDRSQRQSPQVISSKPQS